jgi:GTP pyrophosphokinase
LEEIRLRFGTPVAEIVLAVSDSHLDPKPPWHKRKEAYISSIQNASPSAIRVSLADKVYNARATLRDVRRDGDDAWAGFKGGRNGTLWYYKQLIQAFEKHGSRTLLSELIRIVEHLEELSDRDTQEGTV